MYESYVKYPVVVFLMLSVFIACTKEPDDPPSPPVVVKVATIVTGEAGGIRVDTAVIQSLITLHDDPKPILEAGICYDSLQNPDITKTVIVSTETSGNFISVLIGLSPLTTYYARAYYKNAFGTVYGNQVSFIAARYPVVLGKFYFDGAISSLCTDPAGNVYAGGSFFHAGNGSDWYYLAKYDGSSWIEVPGMKAGNAIHALCSNPAGDVFAGTLDNNNRSDYYMKKLSGASWSDLGLYNNYNFPFIQVCTDNFNNVYAIGTHNNANNEYYVAHWGPSGYEELGSFSEPIETICTDAAGNVYIGGIMNHGYMNNQGNFYVAKWNGTAWSELGVFNDAITSMTVDPSGNLLVAGGFTLDLDGAIQSGGPFYNAGPKFYVARFDGTAWSKVGDYPIAKDYFNNIEEMITDPAGNIYVTGNFRNIAGQYFITKFNGTSWSEFAAFNGPVNAMCSDSRGTIYAGGSFRRAPEGCYIAKCN